MNGLGRTQVVEGVFCFHCGKVADSFKELDENRMTERNCEHPSASTFSFPPNRSPHITDYKGRES